MPAYVNMSGQWDSNLKQQNVVKSLKSVKSQTAINTTNQAISHPKSTVEQRKNIRQLASTAAIEETHRMMLRILHDQIAAKQIYPDLALQLNQQGTVTIGFTLLPSGMVTGASILASSGFSSIDSAALMAVQAISPVRTAANYLNASEYFTIDIVFR